MITVFALVERGMVMLRTSPKVSWMSEKIIFKGALDSRAHTIIWVKRGWCFFCLFLLLFFLGFFLKARECEGARENCSKQSRSLFSAISVENNACCCKHL